MTELDLAASSLPAGDELASLRALRGLVIDMDGVLWHGDRPLPGFGEFFRVLRRRGIKFILATNNNTQTPATFAAKATRLGAPVAPEEVITATVVTIHYLRRRFRPGSRIYVIGEAAMKQLLAEAGFELADRDVVAVVAALDRNLTYEMVKRATLLIRAGAAFIGANPDRAYPTDEGIVPGSGMVLAAVEASTDCPPLIMGKPERAMFEVALERMGLCADEAASLGDRLETDVEGGQRAGLQTILVLSGVTTPAMLAASPLKPTWVFPGIGELAAALGVPD